MRLDHVSYVASHDQISDVVNRIGSQIGTAFIDGGIHPKFGTRNFTAPLLNGQYVEIVCPLDHPATDATPFGQAVKKKADGGGGWLFIVLSTQNITTEELRLRRVATTGFRRKPNGEYMEWKQIGVLDAMDTPGLPYFIEWKGINHPSTDGTPRAKLVEIEINVPDKNIRSFGNDISYFENLPTLNFKVNKEPGGIQVVRFLFNNKTIEII